MCGRYFIETDQPTEELRRIIASMNRMPEGTKTAGEICPGDTVPVLAPSRKSGSGVYAMRWGFRLKDQRLIFNTRSETAGEKPLFRDGFSRRRCLIPANGYYEWDSSRMKYSVRPKNGGLFYLAGIYRLEDSQPVFSVLTQNPSEEIAFLHPRMPVMLSGSLAAGWLDPDADPVKFIEKSGFDLAWKPQGAAQLQF